MSDPLLHTIYKNIEFVRLSKGPSVAVWSCRNRQQRVEIGQVFQVVRGGEFYFKPSGGTILSAEVTSEIGTFLVAANRECRGISIPHRTP